MLAIESSKLLKYIRSCSFFSFFFFFVDKFQVNNFKTNIFELKDLSNN